ncbi:hypothetical protein HID58_002798 [Brassica napus]|uniref:STAS domain-containing protein n=1 Tax=Brassica napus TaxID=3708 RepID=A0ABQ8ERD9_BRANA|nr:hypothetical protein HID58_002798 [Brassica napus]
MKTVRPDEFASPHFEDSISSIASRSDDQMIFLLSTIDHIDEVKFVDTLGIYRFFEKYFADCLLMEQEEKTDIYNKLGFDFSL